MDFEICNSSDRALNCYGDAHKMSFQLILAPASLAKLHGNAILTSREELSELLLKYTFGMYFFFTFYMLTVQLISDKLI